MTAKIKDVIKDLREFLLFEKDKKAKEEIRKEIERLEKYLKSKNKEI